MPELRHVALDVVLCQADAATLDRLVPPGHGSRILRTAPDELLVVAQAGTGADVLREVADRVAALDPHALALDVTDGWSAWTLSGADANEAFSRLSALEPPEDGAFVQGDVARVGVKAIGEPDGALTLLVPAYWGDHVRQLSLADAGAVEASR